MWPFSRTKWEELGVSVNREELKGIIRNSVAESTFIRIRDGQLPMRCLPIADFETLILKSRKIDPPYQTEKFDCDDSQDTFLADLKRGWEYYSHGEEALCFGKITLRLVGAKANHAMNWMMDDEKKLHLIEPQTDLFVERMILKVFTVTQ